MKYEYALITNIMTPRALEYERRLPGIFQWVNAFGGTIYHARSILSRSEKLDVDIVHVPLSPENIHLGYMLRQKKLLKKMAKLVGCLDPGSTIDTVRAMNELVNSHTEDLRSFDLIHLPFTSDGELPAFIAIPGVRNISHPSNVGEFERRRDHTPNKDESYIVFINRDGIDYSAVSRHLRTTSGMKTIILLDPGDVFRGDSIAYDRVMLPTTCDELIGVLRNTAALVDISLFPVFDKYVLLAAELGIPVVGSSEVEGIAVCYPHTTVKWVDEVAGLVEKILCDDKYRAIVAAFAGSNKKEYGYAQAAKKMISSLIRYSREVDANSGADPECVVEKSIVSYASNESRMLTIQSLEQHIRHVFGRGRFVCDPKECRLVCLVRNGALYVNSFIEHYKKLGITHFYFIDNGSSDGTVGLIKRHDATTVYETSLPFKDYECSIRRVIIKKLIDNRWCLAVDIDEFFDYPFSENVSLGRFIGYLEASGYTALVAYMLDMFSIKPAEKRGKYDKGHFKESDYDFYDLSDIVYKDYPSDRRVCSGNTLSDTHIKDCMGGIRRRMFGNISSYFLIKHPLLFIDKKIDPFTHPHFSNNAVIADVSAVLRHYKLVASFFERVKKAIDDNNFPNYAQVEYASYYNYFLSNGNLKIDTVHPQKWESVNKLVDQGLLYASDKYKYYANDVGSGMQVRYL